MTDKVLVTGGCGVLGSRIVNMLREWGHPTIVIDDMSRYSVPAGGDFFLGDFADPDLLYRVFSDHLDIRTVIHCAAFTSPAESVENPELYRLNNVHKTRMLIGFLEGARVDNFIFASSASVYGRTSLDYILEDEPFDPRSPYAMTKAVIEHELHRSPLRSIAFRYFNPIGAKLTPGTALHSVFESAKNGTPFVINGNNWGTTDGTPVRDFIDVEDLALAHAAAVDCISSFPRGVVPINLGSGYGTTMGRLVNVVKEITGRTFPVEYGPRRAGDIRGGAANVARAGQLLSWVPRVPLRTSVARAWELF